MTYVISDIHGRKDRFDSILKQIDLKSEDTLYILGDVIDRNPDGLRILRQIMAMPNVKMLLGNHEYMMLQAISYYTEDDLDNPPYFRERKLRLWYNNGGDITHYQLKHLRKSFREEVFDYLRNLPLNIEVTVNGQQFLLAHGSPEALYEYSDWSHKNSVEYAVWNRYSGAEPDIGDCTILFGHTGTHHYQTNNSMTIWHGGSWIGMDCGCGYDEPDAWFEYQGRLGCLRLDDMKEFYSEDAKERT